MAAMIIDPNSASFAPPSLQQTLQIAGNLQDQVDDLGARLRQVQENLDSTNDILGVVRKELNKSAAAVNHNASTQNELIQSIEALKRDLSKATVTVHRMRSAQEVSKEDMTHLKESHRGFNMQVSGIREELADLRAQLQELKQDTKVKKVGDKVHGDDYKIDRLFSTMETLQAEHDKGKNMIKETCESLSMVANDVHVLKDSFSKMSSTTSHLDSKVTEYGTSVKSTREKIQQVGSTVVRLVQLTDEHTGEFQDMHGGFLECQARISGLERLVEDSRNSLQTAQLRIEREAAGLQTVRDDLDRAEGRLTQGSERQETFATQVRTMQIHFQETQSAINEILEGIRDTNALVLPNVLQTGVGKELSPKLLSKVGSYSPQSARGQNPKLGGRPRGPWLPEKNSDWSAMSPRPPSNPSWS